MRVRSADRFERFSIAEPSLHRAGREVGVPAGAAVGALLVSRSLLRNTKAEYTQLSSRTSEMRRLDSFPELMDASRAIEQVGSFRSPDEAREYLRPGRG